MKLLQLNVTANWGSTGRIAEGIGQAAMNRGWESVIAYGRDLNPSMSSLIKVGNHVDVFLHYARHRLLDGEGLGSRRATSRFIEQIIQYAPDIIHLHNIHDHWLNFPLLFDYLATVDTPIVWTLHDCWAFTGGCTHFENIGCFKWRDDECSGVCPQKRGKLSNNNELNFLHRKISIDPLKDRMTIVGASNWVSEYVRQSYLKGCCITTYYNGIDLSLFRQEEIGKGKMILGVSNVWPPDKGLQDFIELRRLLPNDIAIRLVGLNKKQIESLPEGIQGIERTQNVAELVELYNRASVFVNPTYNDTFPTVNLEALACGTPVVTYRTGGSPEAIDDRTGIVVDKGDVIGMANAIMKIINNPEQYNSIDCRCRAENHFNKDIQFDKYIDLYESILSKK